MTLSYKTHDYPGKKENELLCDSVLEDQYPLFILKNEHSATYTRKYIVIFVCCIE